MQSNALIVSGFILLAGFIWMQANREEKRDVLLQTRKFFGDVLTTTQKPNAYWQHYLDGLQTELNRIGLEKIAVAKYAKFVPVGALLFLMITHFVFGVPYWIGATMAALLLLLPRQLVAELSARYVVNIRKRLIADVIDPGMHALGSGTLEEVCVEIEREAKSPVIRREFKYINELGKAPGDWNVARAMLIRARMLGIPEFETLAILTAEGQRYNAKLTEIWRTTHTALADKVQTQSSLLADIAIYRMVAMVMFLALVTVITFGYRLLHAQGIIQFGLFLTLISFFVGISQVANTKNV